MNLVIITALAVGGATVIGAFIGFAFEKVPHKYNDMILGFAAGVMLSAAVFSLIQPSVELGGKHGVWLTIVGIIAGALFLNLADRFIPHAHHLVGIDSEKHAGDMEKLNKTMLFIFAIAIHNFPEGMAAGVSFGTNDISNGITVAAGIALHNIPEGMIVIAPLLATGLSKARVLGIAALTGLVEVVGTFIGYIGVSVSVAVLPFALAFAGGTMLYVVSDEMIPETHGDGHESSSTYALIAGFSLMLILGAYL